MESKDLEELFVSQWEQSIQKNRTRLEPNDLDELKHLNSWDSVRKDLLDSPNGGPSDLAKAQPALGYVYQLTSIFETKLGPRLDAGFLWGVLGILLQVASTDRDATRRLPRMLKVIGYKADAFTNCCEASPDMGNQLKVACFDINSELVEFCVDAIRCLRRDDDDKEEQIEPIEKMEKCYLSMITELERILAEMEKLVQRNVSLAYRTKPKSPEASNTPPKKPITVLLPQTRTMRIFNRTDLFEELDRAFGDSPKSSFKSVALWGLGGVGKSTVALRYIETLMNKSKYDAMLWIHAEKRTSLQASFTDIAMKLKLPGAKPQPQFHAENLDLVQGWLQSTDSAWLLVYDNVSASDTSSIIDYWPIANRGHVIITTRSSSVAANQTIAAVEVKSWNVKMGTDFLMFLLQKQIGKDIEKEGVSAEELSKRLAGHALGITHMAGLIHRRRWTISEFMSIYLNNPRRAHGSEIQALWDFSFQSLSDDARKFMGVISFLMPDDIPSSLFEVKDGLPRGLEFCSDDFSFPEVIEDLLDVSLIKKNRDTRAFSVHRMVQTQFKYFLKPPELQESFEDAVMLVYRDFPRMGDEKGQLYDQWEKCNAMLQHVISLKDCFRDCRNSDKKFKAPWQFCDLLRECQRYLYESNSFKDLEDMCQVNLDAVGTIEDEKKTKELLPHIYSHQANLCEGLGQVERAIELNKKGYNIRLEEDPINQVLCYGFEANLGYTYNTANDHEMAMEWFKKARTRWLQFVDKTGDENNYPSVLKKNMARCLVYMGELADARLLLGTAIAEFKATKPLNWGMLAFAYQVLGQIERLDKDLESSEAHFFEAQNTWRLGYQSRLNPFYGGCVYKTGAVCLDQGKTEAAVSHLRDSYDVTDRHKESMPVEYARTCFKLSEALLQDNPHDSTEAEKLREDAEIFLKRRDPDAKDFSSEAAYDKFIPIFWR